MEQKTTLPLAAIAALHRGHRVEAIKLVRAESGIDLKEAKQRVEVDLPNESREARICTFECTFCSACAGTKLNNVCPNCKGELVRRPIRPAQALARHPASTERVFKPAGCAGAV